MEKKKILLVAPYNNGTIGLCSLNLFNAIKSRLDLEVKCVVLHRFDNGYDGFDNCEWCLSSEALSFKKCLNLFKQIRWLRKIKKHFNPDITISTLNGCSTINVISGGKDKKIGIFHAPHSQLKEQGKLVYLNTLLNFKFIYPKLDKIVCVSTEVKRTILTAFPCFKNKNIQVIYNVHNFEDIINKSHIMLNDEEVRFMNKNTILYIGRLDRNKAPMRAVRAFKEAIPNIPNDAHLVLIGRDVDGIQNELEQFVELYNLKERVFYIGFQSNPYKFMTNSKALILTSYSESLPGVIVESLLLKKPVITTNSSEGIWEIMSCHGSYDKTLLTYHKCHDGIISSNLSFSNYANDLADIDNLKNSIVQIYDSDIKVQFDFRRLIEHDAIIECLLN